MTQEIGPLETEQLFFAALLEGNANSLNTLLTDDFILVDVMTGSEIPKEALIGVVGSGLLEFLTMEVIESRVRSYGDTAIITGRTAMTGRYEGQPFGAASRYTHVFVKQGGRWRMATAQGTPIVENPS